MQSNFVNISATETKSALETNGKIVLLDVRTPKEIAEGKIQNALEIDYKEEDFKSNLSKLNKDDAYIVYCRSGRRSAETSQMMTEMGFKDVKNLEGGILAWNELNKK